MADRVDRNGAAYAGSQLQTQLWVNRRPRELAEAVGAELPALVGSEIEWRSPLAGESYAEYRDDAFLDRLDLGAHKAQLREFWPRGGPHWDGLAVVRSERNRPEILLLEGKSYPGELYGSGCQAAPGSASRVQIECVPGSRISSSSTTRIGRPPRWGGPPLFRKPMRSSA